MTNAKLLIVDDNVQIRTAVRSYFLKAPHISVVGVASNGDEALALTLEHRPDVVLLDIVMPHSDGFGYLERLQQLDGIHPTIIILSALARDELIARAIELGASFYMIKPFDLDMLYRRILSYCDITPGSAQAGIGQEKAVPEPPAGNPDADSMSPAPSLSDGIDDVFLTIGIPPHIRGYVFLREAVKLVIKDKELIGKITKELYPSVAKRFGTTPSKVERSIRHAIEVAWTRQDTEAINRTIGGSVFSSWGRPSNGEFIARVAGIVIRDKHPL